MFVDDFYVKFETGSLGVKNLVIGPILLKMFVLMISRSSLKLGHFLGLNLGYKAKSKEKLVNIQEVRFLISHHESCSKCLSS